MKVEGILLFLILLIGIALFVMQTRSSSGEQGSTIVQPVWVTPETRYFYSDWDWPRGWSNRWWDNGPYVHPSRGHYERPHNRPHPPPHSPPPSPPPPQPAPAPPPPPPPPPPPTPPSPPPAPPSPAPPPTTESFIGSPYPFA